VSSDDPPLPNWFPSFKSFRATVGYRYDDIKTAPSFLEGDARFANDFGELTVQPTFQVKQRKGGMVVQATKGESYMIARFTAKGKRFLEFLRGSYAVSLPFASISGVRVTPSYDFVKSDLSLLVEGVTGSARTKAILNLQYQEPTLTVVHALDERYEKSHCRVDTGCVIQEVLSYHSNHFSRSRSRSRSLSIYISLCP
jgi:hypothetical protein